jgi:DNA sulfur modification protein DndE
MPIEHIHLSQQAKDQLTKIKRGTGIQNWNTLCRWAFCLSLSEPGIPPPAKIPADSSVDITWKVFGGPFSDIYLALLKERCRRDQLGTTDEVVAAQFRLHLHRGIGYLAANKNIKSIQALLKSLPLQVPAER